MVEGAYSTVLPALLGFIELTRELWQTHRSAYILYPYYVILYGGLASCTYAMGRLLMVRTCWTCSD